MVITLFQSAFLEYHICLMEQPFEIIGVGNLCYHYRYLQLQFFSCFCHIFFCPGVYNMHCKYTWISPVFCLPNVFFLIIFLMVCLSVYRSILYLLFFIVSVSLTWTSLWWTIFKHLCQVKIHWTRKHVCMGRAWCSVNTCSYFHICYCSDTNRHKAV